MGVMVYSLLWVMQDLYHQPYTKEINDWKPGAQISDAAATIRPTAMAARVPDVALWRTWRHSDSGGKLSSGPKPWR